MVYAHYAHSAALAVGGVGRQFYFSFLHLFGKAQKFEIGIISLVDAVKGYVPKPQQILPFKTSALFGQINFGKTGVVIYFCYKAVDGVGGGIFSEEGNKSEKVPSLFISRLGRKPQRRVHIAFSVFCAYFGSLVCRKTENRAHHGRQKRNVVKGIVDNFENRHHFRNLGNGKEILRMGI